MRSAASYRRNGVLGKAVVAFGALLHAAYMVMYSAPWGGYDAQLTFFMPASRARIMPHVPRQKEDAKQRRRRRPLDDSMPQQPPSELLKKNTLEAEPAAPDTRIRSITLYKIDEGKCGQATLDKKYATMAAKFTPLKEGSCVNHGYTVSAGEKALQVPVLGDINVALFKKPSLSMAEAVESMSMYKIDGADLRLA